MDSEQIKKGLEICANNGDCKECPINPKRGNYGYCTSLAIKHALTLINSQEQTIKELTEERKDFEIRALRAENQAAMYQDRWETSRKDFERLVGEYERLHASCTELTRVQEENERLRAENEALAISGVKECEISQTLVYRIRDKHPAVMAVIADTVRKMQTKFWQEVGEIGDYQKWEIVEAFEKISKELLEGL